MLTDVSVHWVILIASFIGCLWFILSRAHGVGTVWQRATKLKATELSVDLAWALIYAVVFDVIYLQVVIVIVNTNNLAVLVPTLYKLMFMVLNIFAVSLFYELILEDVSKITGTRGTNIETRRLHSSISIVSTHLAFGYISALGGIAWFVVFALTYRSGQLWSTMHAKVLLIYAISSALFLFFAWKQTEMFTLFDKYRDYVFHYDPQLKRIANKQALKRGTLIWWIRPDTIDNRLSYFRIWLAGMSVLASVVPI